MHALQIDNTDTINQIDGTATSDIIGASGDFLKLAEQNNFLKN
jgi:hypothetical protein